MNCNCEKAPEFPTKAFIPGPIEIPINFRAVTIPADQGDDTTNPPLNGAYRNVVLQYAANNHTYIYSSDGIPVMLVGGINFDDIANRPKYDGEPMTSDTDIPDLTDEVATLESQIQALATDFSYKGSVADYAHLPSDAATGDVYTTLDTGLIYVWDGTQWVALNDYPDIVQTIGQSTTSIMSQKASTDSVYKYENWDYTPSSGPHAGETLTLMRTSVQLGKSDSMTEASGSVSIYPGDASATGQWSIAIGAGRAWTKLDKGASATGDGAIAIGYGSESKKMSSIAIGSAAEADGSTLYPAGAAIAIGQAARADGRGSIALGSESYASAQGEMNIGVSSPSVYGQFAGYNNSAYRLLTGLYDPQNDHDAATKGYVDTAVSGAVSTINSTDWSNLWQ